MVAASRRPRRTASRRAAVVGSLLAAVGLLVCAAPATASTGALARQPTAGSPGATVDTGTTLTAAEGSSGTVTLAVPAGLTATRLHATMTLGDPAGTATVLLAGAPVATVHGTAHGTVDVPIPAGAVAADGSLPLVLRYDGPQQDGVCRTLTGQATLDDVSLGLRGTEEQPTTVAAFFPALSGRIDVQVAPDADRATLGAALAAVAALSDRYAAPTQVVLDRVGDPLPAAKPGDRVVRLSTGPSPVTTAIGTDAGRPMLELTGPASALTAAADALDDPDRLKLADAATTQDLAQQRAPRDLDAELHRTLQDATGADDLVLQGYGTTSTYVGLPQDLFGGPVSSLSLHLRITHTAIQHGAAAQLDVLFNNRLLTSRDLTRDTTSSLTIDTRADATDLNASNGLVLRLSSLPANGHCTGTQVPLEVHVDTAASAVVGTRGPGKVAGFARFPQALGGSLPVALEGSGSALFTRAQEAAGLVVDLQRSAAAPLSVTAVSAHTLVAGHDSGLLVGATPADATSLHAPLRLGGLRVMDYLAGKFQVDPSTPYAVLEAVHTGGRDVLMLGGWAPAGAAPTDLADKAVAAVGTKGWTGLSDDVLVATASQAPFTLASSSFVPSAQQADEHRGYVKWLLLGIGILVVLLLLNLALARRRRRQIAALVDAQERADARAGQVEDDDGR